MLLFDREIWKEIYESLMSNKLRTALTAFGVLWGILMLVVMLGASEGLKNGVQSQFGKIDVNSAFINLRATSIDYKGYPRGRNFNLKNADVEYIKQNFDDIKYLSAGVYVSNNQGQPNTIIRGKYSDAFDIMGEEPDRGRIDPLNIVEGRYINELDIVHKRKVCLIGQTVYNSLFPEGGNVVGEYININGVYFKVCGVFKSFNSGGWADWQNRLIFLPRTTAQQTYNLGDAIYWLGISTNDGVDVGKLSEKITAILAERHSVSPDDKMAFRVRDISQQYKQAMGLMSGIKFLTWIVGIFTLLAGVIGISNIMLIAIKDRTKEIGVRRAIGATPSVIIGQIVFEAILLTIVAGYMGLTLGVIIVELLGQAIASDSDFFINPFVDIGTALNALLVLSIGGLLSGIIPAMRAVKIKPVEALRD